MSDEQAGRTVPVDPLVAALLSDVPQGPQRWMLGLAGAPGAGKTTLADSLVTALGPEAIALPMDGFHLADRTLARLGLLERKGTPETFDAAGYAALLARVRSDGPGTVYAPAFERDLEQPLAGAIAVEAHHRRVVTEGNYLLLDAWAPARQTLDAVWFLDIDAELRRERLVARHVRFGKTPEEARAWVDSVDDIGAGLVDAARDRADRVIDVTEWAE